MKCLAVLLVLAPWLGTSWADIVAKVVGVHDGDTLTILVERKQVRVRLVDIDAPELGQPFGKRSRQSLSQLCAGKQAQVNEGKDRYGRTLGSVVCNGVNANVEQVRTGMAWVFDRYVNSNSSLYSAQKQARELRLGLWSTEHQVPPWQWRALETKVKR